MKKTALFLALTIATTLALSACGSAADEPESDTDISHAAVKEAEAAEPPETVEQDDVKPYVVAEWSEEAWSDLAPLFSGLGDMAFVTGTADREDVHRAVTCDDSIVKNIIFNTTEVDFNTPGEYTAVFTVHFDRDALCDWMDENDVDQTLYSGLEEDAGQVFVPYTATITISDDEAVVAEITETASIAGAVKDNDTSAESDDAQAADTGSADMQADTSGNNADSSPSSNDKGTGTSEGSTNNSSSGTATNNSGSGGGSGSSSGSSSGGNSSGSSGNNSGGSSGSSASTACDHNWVATYHEATGHYEQVLVQAAYDTQESVGSQYVCNNCGYATTDATDIGDHTLFVCGGCGYHSDYIYKDVHHDAVYDTKWVQDSAAYTTYTCSKCGATK